MTFFWYHPVNQYIHEEGATTWQQVKETDFIGCFIFIAGLVLFLLGLSFGGSTYPWYSKPLLTIDLIVILASRVSAGTLAPLIIGALTLLATGFYEAFAKPKWPIFPTSIFKNLRGFTLVQAGVFLYGMSFYATAVLWPTQVQTLFAKTPFDIGWYSGATGFGGLLFSVPIGYLVMKLRRVRQQLWFYVFGLLVISGCQAIVTPDSHISSTILVILLFFVVSGVNITTITYVQVAVKHEFIGIATGINTCTRAVGGAVGQVIYTTILSNTLQKNIKTDVAIPLVEAGVTPSTLPEVIEALLAGETTSKAVAALTPTQLMIAGKGIAEAYAGGFRIVYLATIAFGTVGLIIVAFVSDIDHLITKKVDIKLQEGAILNAQTDTGAGHIIHQNERSA